LWTLSPRSGYSEGSLAIRETGTVYNCYGIISAVPVVFLKSNVTLSTESGSGSSPSDAYILQYDGS